HLTLTGALTIPDGTYIAAYGSTVGIDMKNDVNPASATSFWGAAMKIPNNVAIQGYSADSSTQYNLARVTSGNVVRLGSSGVGMIIDSSSSIELAPAGSAYLLLNQRTDPGAPAALKAAWYL